ncbi:uncharacterized protein LOC144452593 [Glandiceps talaboti]
MAMKIFTIVTIFGVIWMPTVWGRYVDVSIGKEVFTPGTLFDHDFSAVADDDKKTCHGTGETYIGMDLGAEYFIKKIKIKVGSDLSSGFKKMIVRAGNNRDMTHTKRCFIANEEAVKERLVKTCGGVTARYVFINKQKKSSILSICDWKVIANIEEPEEGETVGA